MMLDAGVTREDVASVRAFSTGATTFDPRLRQEAEAAYGIPILQSYGATEFGGVVAATTLADRQAYGEAKADSVGRPWGTATLRVCDVETGEELPAGQEGRLQIRAPPMAHDWVDTTDLAVIDADGFLWHRGRLDGAIMRGGFKIIPEQVSSTLLSHPAIAAAAVVGIADPRVGEAPAAAYVVRPGMTAPSVAELEAHLRDRLPSTAIPVRFQVVDSLPVTPSLKVDRAAVKAILST